MISQWRRAFVACAFAVFAPMSIAQVISVPGGALTGGSTITVGFSDSSRAGEKVTVTVSNNMPGPLYEEDVIEIQLDASGKGSRTWVVDELWTQAAFFGEGAAEVITAIN